MFGIFFKVILRIEWVDILTKLAINEYFLKAGESFRGIEPLMYI